MLVNLSKNKKSDTKAQKFIRKSMHERFGREYMKKAKKWYKFKGLFQKYQPADDEYTPNDLTNFTGVYFYPDHNWMEMWINQFTNQTATELWMSDDSWLHYGLCDNASQVIHYYNDWVAKGHFKGNHVILLVPMSANDGWRWHKWGEYIGNFVPRHEYACDEEGLKGVYAFQIIKIK